MNAPERIRVAQDTEGFWTCREAVSGSQEYVRADLHEAALAEARAETAAVIEEAAQACDDYPRVAPDETEWPHYDDQIDHSQRIIRALTLDHAKAALDEIKRQARESMLDQVIGLLVDMGLIGDHPDDPSLLMVRALIDQAPEER